MIALGLNGYGLDDSQVRITVQDDSSAIIGFSARRSPIAKLSGGEIKQAKPPKEARPFTIDLMVYGSTDLELWQRVQAIYALLDQPTLELSVTVDGTFKVVATVELMTVQDKADYSIASKTAKTSAIVQLIDVVWRDPSYTTVTLPTAGTTGALASLAGAGTAMRDAKILIPGDSSTPLSAFSCTDTNSGTGIQWTSPTLTIGQYLSESAAGSNPALIAREAATEDFFVAAYGSTTINRYTSGGGLRSTLTRPSGVTALAVVGGSLYVGRGITSGFAIDVMNANNFPATVSATWTVSSRVQAITADSSGNVYAIANGNATIYKYSSTGTAITNWAVTTGLALLVVSSTLYAITNGGSNIRQYSLTGTAGTVWTATDSPYALASDFTYIYTVANSGSMTRYTSAGVPLAMGGSSGSGPGQVSQALSIVTDATGHVYVPSALRGTIAKFDADGVFDGIVSGQWLLIDVAAMTAQVVKTASFDATGDSVTTGLSTVPFSGRRLQLTPSPVSGDLFTRAVNVAITQTGGTGGSLRVKRAFL